VNTSKCHTSPLRSGPPRLSYASLNVNQIYMPPLLLTGCSRHPTPHLRQQVITRKKQVCHTITYSAHSMWNSSPPTPTVHHTVHNAVANTEQFNSRPQRLPYSLLILNRLNNTYMPLLTITCMLYIRAKFKQEPSAFPNYQLSTFALLGRYAAYVRSSLPTFRKKWHR